MNAAAEQTAKPRPWLGLSLFQRVLLALSLGLTLGLLIGEFAAPLRIVGDVYVGLLQMTVLPFIVCSVISNIGRLTVVEAKRLARVGLAVLAALWALGFAAIVIIAQALPTLPAGSFFSTSLLEPSREFDFLAIFVPSNPFRSLAENLVPGVVVFCIFVGLALIRSPDKTPIITALDSLNDLLGRVANSITTLSPFGVFAISASAAGTITLEEFGRLQAYLVIFAIAVLILTLVVLPLVIAAVTPFTFRDVLETQGNVLVTAFAIGSVFAVIPMMVEAQKTMVERLAERRPGIDREALAAGAEFAIPLAYPFPHLGKIVTLIFLPFAAWFYGQPLGLMDYPNLLGTATFLSFGKVTVTVPFLLDLLEIPADIFRLFLMSSVIASPLSDLMGAAHLMAFTTLLTCALNGMLRLRNFRALTAAAISVGVLVLTSVATERGLAFLLSDLFRRENVIANMSLLETRVPFEIAPIGEPNPDVLLPDETGYQRIIRRNKLRVGFEPDNLPFTYYNANGDLVGHDIDLAHRLAQDSELDLEFVPFHPATLREQLAEDHFDVAISGIGVSLTAFPDDAWSIPYMTLNLAFVVRDHDKDEFSDFESLGTGKRLVIGVYEGQRFENQVRKALPDARIVTLWSESQFFEGPPEWMDALATSAQVGSAWTLIHPEYAVAHMPMLELSSPVAMLIAGGDEKTEDTLETWIRIKQHDGSLDRLHEYWILGRGASPTGKRWSVIRDVLGWVD